MLDLAPDLMAVLTSKKEEAQLHVDSLGALNPERLQQRLDSSSWTHVVAFRPTGAPPHQAILLQTRTLLPLFPLIGVLFLSPCDKNG